MNKVTKALVITGKKDLALELCAGAGQLAQDVAVVALNSSCAINASRAYVVDASEASIIQSLPVIKSIVEKEKPQLVVTELTRDGRLVAAAIAAACRTSVLTDCTSLAVDAEGKVCAERMSYGGKAVKSEYALGETAVACVGYGVFAAADECAADVVEKADMELCDNVRLLESTPKQVQKVNLGAARKVLGVGRGVGDGSRLGEMEAFAAKLGAEMACTRPVAEEEHLMPKERYVGVTGCTIKPDLYVAMGISGVIQHMAGVNSSGTIIAVNKDKNAPIFKQCDYGIVGDIFEVAKLIEEELK